MPIQCSSSSVPSAGGSGSVSSTAIGGLVFLCRLSSGWPGQSCPDLGFHHMSCCGSHSATAPWEMNINLIKLERLQGHCSSPAGLFRAGHSEGRVRKRWAVLVASVKAQALCQPDEGARSATAHSGCSYDCWHQGTTSSPLASVTAIQNSRQI